MPVSGCPRHCQDAVLEVLLAVVDSQGRREHGDGGGDDEPETIPCLATVEECRQAEHGVGQEEHTSADERGFAIVEV